MRYRIELTKDDNGTFLVTCPAFPEVTTYGEDRAQAKRNARAAIEEAIAARISDSDPLPSQAGAGAKGLFAKTSLLTSIKALLYMTALRKAVNRAELARRLGWHREQVDRLFRIGHASRLDQI